MRTMTMIQDKRYVNKLILTVRFQMMSEHLIRLQQVKKQFNQLSCIEAEIFNCNHFFDLMFCTVMKQAVFSNKTINFVCSLKAGLTRIFEKFSAHVPEEKLEPLRMEHFYLGELIELYFIYYLFCDFRFFGPRSWVFSISYCMCD